MYYTVKLLYNPEPRTQTLKESITHCASIQLYLRGIVCFQTSATRLVFETEKDRTLALLMLSDSRDFRAVAVE
jgi:hypothetical protein